MKLEESANRTFAKLCDIGVVVKNLDKTIRQLETLGIGPFVPAQPPEGAEGLFYLGEPLVSRFRGLAAHLENVEMEVFEPGEGTSPWADHLKNRGEGLHHLGFQVEDVEKATARLTALGGEVIMTGKVNGKLAAVYIEMYAGQFLIELIDFPTD